MSMLIHHTLMSDKPISRLLRVATRRRKASPPAAADDGRRQFFRRAGMGTLGALSAGLLTPDEAWAGIEERASRFGIVPGTVVDAQGRPVANPSTSEPYLGEIMMFGGNFAVRGFMKCDGQLLPINQNQSLYSLLGTTYGGDGRTTFALPDLRGRAPVGMGTGAGLQPQPLGARSGQETVTLTQQNLPSHTHPLPVLNAPGDQRTPSGNILAGDATNDTIYAAASRANAQLAPTQASGGGQPINVLDPSLVISIQVAIQGLFPSRT